MEAGMSTEQPFPTSLSPPLRSLILLEQPFWKRSRKHRAARLGVFVCYFYFASLLLALALEDWFLYPGATVARPWLEPPAYLNVRELILDSGRGDRIHAWFSAPEGWKPQMGAILHSHGNGSNMSRMSGRAFRWREPLGRAVLLYDYPGYGKSSGHPSEMDCYAAGEAAWQWLLEESVPSEGIILVGESMGGAIAIELATRHAARLLVLHGAFTSFPDMAQTRLPIFPSRYLVHNRMDNEAKIPFAKCPVLITHGTSDTVVPFHQGERLFAAAQEPKLFIRMDGHGHGPPNQPDFFENVKQFLARTSTGVGASTDRTE
jgi:pimeloyl-ACP methyl ester carboxylesterase